MLVTTAANDVLVCGPVVVGNALEKAVVICFVVVFDAVVAPTQSEKHDIMTITNMISLYFVKMQC